MNKIEKIELEKSINSLEARNNELKGLILASNYLDDAEKMDNEFKENLIKIIEAQNKLDNAEKGEIKMPKYLEAKNSVEDFIKILQTSDNKNVAANKWNEKLAENGLEIKDDTLILPKRIVSAIETSLTDTNPVFKTFKLTHVGALLISQGLDSSDEANVHVEGTEKKDKDEFMEVPEQLKIPFE